MAAFLPLFLSVIYIYERAGKREKAWYTITHSTQNTGCASLWLDPKRQRPGRNRYIQRVLTGRAEDEDNNSFITVYTPACILEEKALSVDAVLVESGRRKQDSAESVCSMNMAYSKV